MRTKSKASGWPKKLRLGRFTVTIYRRATPAGLPCYMVANYAAGKRRFDSYPSEAAALDAANLLARRLSERDVLAASMTNEQAADYAAAVQILAPFKLPLSATVSTVGECLKLVGGDLPNLHAAVKFYAARHKLTTRKPVADVLAEMPPPSPPDVKLLSALARHVHGDPNELLRHRFLCRGAGLLLVGPTGIGKSWFFQEDHG